MLLKRRPIVVTTPLTIQEGWTWEEVRGWIDGEGSIAGKVKKVRLKRDKIYTARQRWVDIRVFQKAPTPLYSMCQWIKSQGLPCYIHYREKEGKYEAMLKHDPRTPLPALKGLKLPKRKAQLQRALQKTGLSL